MNVRSFFIGAVLTLIGLNDLDAQERFRSCSAAFLDQHMIVTEYTDHGICEVSKLSGGTLTVQTVYLSPEENRPTGKLKFRLAIQDGDTGTIWSYSDKTYQDISIQEILGKCRAGDQIVLMTVDDDFALPHSKIAVKE